MVYDGIYIFTTATLLIGLAIYLNNKYNKLASSQYNWIVPDPKIFLRCDCIDNHTEDNYHNNSINCPCGCHADIGTTLRNTIHPITK